MKQKVSIFFYRLMNGRGIMTA